MTHQHEFRAKPSLFGDGGLYCIHCGDDRSSIRHREMLEDIQKSHDTNNSHQWKAGRHALSCWCGKFKGAPA